MSEPASEQSLFLHALGLPTRADRAAYLDEACRGQPGLRAELDALLAAHDRLGGGLPRTTGQEPAGPGPGAGGEEVGAVLSGRYKLVELLGEGGMGTVWMAQQTEPVRRLVAVKVVKAGMDSKQVLARFEAERQALALMDHPNIARVLDAGTTAAGRPYFVMELVKGAPITRYCDEHRLTPRQRLGLFVPVCQAIQHAHQKGIIHRDIKPSNVLVALYDGQPVPKVIDFGIAKAAGQPLTDKTLVTGFGAVVGTLEYMSPEQAELNQLDIDTRGDVYSLGVLLYELLTGTTPLEKRRLKEATVLEVLRLIREEEPPRPSTRLSTTDELPSVAANRGLEPKKLSGLVKGELDWIALRALEKDRNRRYDSANSLVADVQRYLADEPVLACPPSAWYLLRKFARRHKGRLAVAGLILFFIAVLGGGGGWALHDRGARQAKAANDLEQALDRAELFQREGKRVEALAAVERAELLADQAPPDPTRVKRLVDLKEWLAAEARDQEFLARFEDIRLRAQSQVDVTKSLFTHQAAYPEIRDALGRYGVTIGATRPALAAARLLGRPQASRRELIAALDECLKLAPAGDAQARRWLLATLAAADADPWRARVRQAVGDARWKQLEQLARAVDVRKHPPNFLLLAARSFPAPMRATRLELLRRIQRAYPADLWANHDLAYELQGNGQPAEAVRYYTAALVSRPNNPGIYVNRGFALKGAGELDAAIADFREAAALAPGYATPHVNLGDALRAKGRLDEAIAAYREAIRLKKDFPEVHNNLGNALRDKGRLDEAIAEYREALGSKQDFPEAYGAHYNLGLALQAKGRLDEAIAESREALRLKKDLPEAHYNLGNALRAKGRTDEAIAQWREAIRLRNNYPEAHYNLGNALQGKGRLDEAIAQWREAIRLKKDFPQAHCNLGVVLWRQGQFRQALEALRRGDELGRARGPRWRYPSDRWVRHCERLVELDGQLPGFLAGTATPAGPAEQIELAGLCTLKKWYGAAARFYADAFAAEPKLANDLGAAHRYNAACAAALAGCSQGKDADKLDDKERAHLRRQALDWLRADLEAWRRLLDRGPDKARAIIAEKMRHWLAATDFTGVRGAAALARLPEAERPAWQQLWDDAAETLGRAREKASPKKPSAAR
jgi:eukaryotic-like serine/threonine-protein kinase